MAELMIRRGPDSGRRVTIGEELIIGRSSRSRANDDHFLRLSDGEISRRHVRIFQRDGQYCIEDLQSTNGTLLGRKFLATGKVQFLNDGDEIYLGNTQMVFRLSPSVQDKTTAAPATDPSGLIQRPAAHSLQILPEDQPAPDVSMVVDASRILMQLREHRIADHPAGEDLVKRMQAMVQVSIVLGATTNLDDLLAKITELVFEIFHGAERVFVIACDEDFDEYYPLIVRNRDEEDQSELQSIAISRSIVNDVISRKHAMLLMDAQGDTRFAAQDSVMDLAIRSVMCAPLLYEDKVLGLIQVDTRENASAFSSEDLEVLTGISAQMAISMKNSQLYEEIEGLFEGFVKASVQAIESRDPGTAGHSFRVAEYTEQLAIAVDRADASNLRELTFSREQLQEIRYAALLHDFGKVGVREDVLTKSKKLYPHEMRHFKLRVKYAQTCLERQAYYDLVDVFQNNDMSPEEQQAHRLEIEQELNKEIERLNRFSTRVCEINEPDYHYDKNSGDLQQVRNYHFYDRDHDENQLLSEFEFSALSFSRGSLHPAERREIESHVSHTFEFLSLIPWTSQFSAVPDIAHAHHEKLDGTGYPRGLVAEQIPPQSRIMTIADIFDALTAGDRPYREGISAEIALNIIENEVEKGKVDAQMFKVFVESAAYKLKS